MSKSKAANGQIIDIRSASSENINLQHAILEGLCNEEERTLPTLILYDEKGLQLFDQITYLDEYYLTGAEIRVFEEKAKDIVGHIQDGSVIVELGSGSLRKTSLFLDALEAAGKKAQYYALDLSRSELEASLENLDATRYKNVSVAALHGTYDDGRRFLATIPNDTQKLILWLGSSLGNMERHEAANFIKEFTDDKALKPGDMWLIGIDGRKAKSPERIWRAYNDSKGITRDFIMNGLVHANRILGSNAFNIDDWSYDGRYDEAKGRHEAHYITKRELKVLDITLAKGVRVRVEWSHKYDDFEVARLWDESGLTKTERYSDEDGKYDLYLATVPSFAWSFDHAHFAKNPVPTLDEWTALWKAWDTVTLEMIPESSLLEKPIDLRHPCIFYIGHIPTFLDIHLTRSTKGSLVEPKEFREIFERGIDPDVDDPTKCHDHSEVPENWPALSELLEYRDRVRVRVLALYKSKRIQEPVIARALWMTFEHEVMHIETLLYMLLQSPKTRVPKGVMTPNFSDLAKANRSGKANKQEAFWTRLPSHTSNIGINDPENSLTHVNVFGWDNEKPERMLSSKSISFMSRPITNGEYAEYLTHQESNKLPESWIKYDEKLVNGDRFLDGDVPPSNWFVKSIFGPVSLRDAADWPFMGSYDEISGYARYKGGRIPEESELRTIYDYIYGTEKASSHDHRIIDAVNGHLTLNGVNESPPQKGDKGSLQSGEFSPIAEDEVYWDMTNSNTGFKNWHPVPLPNDKLVGMGFGGCWEWTSTEFQSHEGFISSEIYPGYSADFFDGKHNVVLGGSWATHPRVAGRRSFRNWYQRNYGFAWTGARLVKDI